MWDQWRTVWFALWFLFSLMFWRLLNIKLLFRKSYWFPSWKKLNICQRHNSFKPFHTLMVAKKEKDKNIWTLKFSHCLYLNVMYLQQKSNSCLLLLKWFFSYLTYWIVICNSWKHTRLMWIEAQVHTEIAAAFWCSL